MANVAFLIETGDGDVDLTSAVADQLARLGVNEVALFRDRHTLCVVLGGWAFDPSSAATAASLIGAKPSARTLRPVMQTALRATRQEE